MSTQIEQLADGVGVAVRRHGSLRLIRLQDCGAIVEACRSGGLLILGIEAFKLVDDMVEPNTDLIADFSELASEPREVACLEAAQSAEIYFNDARGRPDLWFDFCLQQR